MFSYDYAPSVWQWCSFRLHSSHAINKLSWLFFFFIHLTMTPSCWLLPAYKNSLKHLDWEPLTYFFEHENLWLDKGMSRCEWFIQSKEATNCFPLTYDKVQMCSLADNWPCLFLSTYGNIPFHYLIYLHCLFPLQLSWIRCDLTEMDFIISTRESSLTEQLLLPKHSFFIHESR